MPAPPLHSSLANSDDDDVFSKCGLVFTKPPPPPQNDIEGGKKEEGHRLIVPQQISTRRRVPVRFADFVEEVDFGQRRTFANFTYVQKRMSGNLNISGDSFVG